MFSSAGTALFLGGGASAETLTLSWADLRQGRPASCTEFLTGFFAHPDCAQQILISRVFSKKITECSPGNERLDGRTIRIAGYVHPLEFKFKSIRSFLLIPLLRQDCRHPPPPLPDQVIGVEFPDGIDVTFDPVWVTGVLRIQRSRNEIAPASYVLEASHIKPAAIPDVTEAR